MGDGNTGEDGTSEGGRDTRDDDGFEAVFAEVEDLFACATVYRRVALFELFHSKLVLDSQVNKNIDKTQENKSCLLGRQ